MSPTDAPDRPLRILIADDHAVVREGLKRMLESTSPQWRVSEAGSGFQALEMLRREPCELAIFDLSMPGMNGLDLLRRVRAEQPRLPVLMLSMHAEEQYAMRAFKAGANGYITKDAATGELIDAVRKVAGGGAYVSRALAERMVLQLNQRIEAPPHDQLSDRENRRAAPPGGGPAADRDRAGAAPVGQDREHAQEPHPGQARPAHHGGADPLRHAARPGG